MGFYAEKKAFDPKWTAGDETHDAALADAGVSVQAFTQVKPQPTSWLVENIVADEAVTIVAGESGAGKTFFGCQLAADVARVLNHRVLLAASGYERPELLRWRLDQAGGDARRVALAALTPKGFTDRRQNPTDDEIVERLSILYHTLEAAGNPKSGILPADAGHDRVRLLVIDDIDGWFGEPGTMLSPGALARAVQRLDELARIKRVAIVVMVRLQLSVEGRISAHQLGRIAHGASLVWMVARDRARAKERGREGGREGETEETVGWATVAARSPDLAAGTTEGPAGTTEGLPVGEPQGDLRSEGCQGRETQTEHGGQCPPYANPQPPIPNPSPLAYSQSARRWFLPVKNNLAADVDSYGRSFELVDGQIRWHANDPAPVLAEALLPSAHNTDRRRERREAEEWIKEALAGGPLSSDEFFAQGIACGFARMTLRRAAGDLGIRAHKTGFNSGWEMRWAPQPEVRGRGSTATVKTSPLRVCGSEGAQVGCEDAQLPADAARIDGEGAQLNAADELQNSLRSGEDAHVEGEDAHVEAEGAHTRAEDAHVTEEDVESPSRSWYDEVLEAVREAC